MEQQPTLNCKPNDDQLIENIKLQLRSLRRDQNWRIAQNDIFKKKTYGVSKNGTIIRETGTLCQLNAITQGKDQLLRGFFNKIS